MANVVTLNVGGQLFAALKSTLLKWNDTYFACMLDGNFKEKDTTQDDVLFIDRNPEYFKIILEFMRAGSIIIPDHIPVNAIEEEAAYFQVKQHMFKEQEEEEVYILDKGLAFDLGSRGERHVSASLSNNVSVYITWICEKGCQSYVSIYEDNAKIAAYYPHRLFTGEIKRMCVAELFPQSTLRVFIGKKKGDDYSVKSKIEEGCDGNHAIEFMYHIEVNESNLRPKKKRKIE